MARIKVCKRCGNEFGALRRQVRCNACRAVFKNDPEEKYKRQINQMTNAAIRSGVLVRRPCEYVIPWSNEHCNRAKTHAHHEDYSKPLEVIWLCHLHHRHRHSVILSGRNEPFVIYRPGQPEPDRDW